MTARSSLFTAEARAGEILEALAGTARRIVVAGSVRWRALEVKDIEIVAEPLWSVGGYDLFGEPVRGDNLLTARLDELVRAGRIERRLDEQGRACWGEKHQRAVYEGVPVDVFQVHDPGQWGLILALRTGPAGFSRQLVTSRSRGGLLPEDLMVKDGWLWCETGDGPPVRIACEEEEDFFEALGID